MKMNYAETIDYLFNKTLVFQHVGAQAYKPGLDTTLQLDKVFGCPEKAFKTIHVAGTNGKGSTSHLLAAILQKAGYRVGLYTSPHLLDFRERIRVDGKMVSEEFVCSFVDKFLNSGYSGRQPSFFELATIMAFKYFEHEKVDVAVIEVGLGGRLDSTNIISPVLSVITNISFDHTQFLGDTLAAIAGEKAGIIKPNTPVVVGEYTDETRPVFEEKAQSVNAPIVFAQDNSEITDFSRSVDSLHLSTSSFGDISDELAGECQTLNADTVLHAVCLLRENGFIITDGNVHDGFASVCRTTGLMGRWMKVDEHPLTICDTGHNPGGFQYIANQLQHAECGTLRVVIGFVSDKDISHILNMLPTDALYFFTQPSVERALPCTVLAKKASEFGLTGSIFTSVKDAYLAAKSGAAADDMIYVGGSTFIVADLLAALKESGKV